MQYLQRFAGGCAARYSFDREGDGHPFGHLSRDIESLWRSLSLAIDRVAASNAAGGPAVRDFFREHGHRDMLESMFRSFGVRSDEHLAWIRASIGRWMDDLEQVGGNTDPEYVWEVVRPLPGQLLSLIDYAANAEGLSEKRRCGFGESVEIPYQANGKVEGSPDGERRRLNCPIAA